MTISNTVNISEIPLDQNDPTKAASGQSLSTQYYFAIANGTDASETFVAADLSSSIQTLMANYGRGVAVNMGGGDDTVVGSAYGDTINAGDGTNYIDGGDNRGTQPGGGLARDVLNVYAASQAAADALTVTQVDASATGADGAAYAQGYHIKVSNGTETDYLKGVEQVNVFVTANSSFSFAKTINLAVDVTEADATQDVSSYMDLAWAHGTGFADTFNAGTDISSATRALMDQHQRGVWVETGAGDDTITGSAYGDDINAGSGTNYVDGGANGGSPPGGGKAVDTLHVTVADQAAASAVQVATLAAGMSGADADAFANGYTHKVVAGGETDYVKDIERVSVQVDTGNGGSTWARDIPLAVVVQEANLSDPAYANNYHLAWVTGTAGDDTIDASAGSTLLSSAVQAAMDAGHHGAYIDGGAGNDTITGTAYADNFVNGPGSSKIDGGANAGPNGEKGMDVFQVTVNFQVEMDGVAVSPSDDPAYQWMVEYYGRDATQKDYLKNVEGIVVTLAGTNTTKWIPLAVKVNEIQAGGDLANSLDYAWVQGTSGDDTFSAATDVSSATRALMDQHQRGVWVDLGAGNDTITGSGYGDDISAGSGINYVDGGANAGSPPWGGKAADTLHVTVAYKEQADAVQVVQLTDGMTGADADAFAQGYAYKVAAGAETDYIKNIERVSVQVDDSHGGSTWVRDIPLSVVVQEANLSDPNIASYYQLAWINGTGNADTIDASAGSTLLSSQAQAAMAGSQRGVWIDGGDGNDTITGSAYADNIRNGAGNDKIDGGANDSANGRGMDVFEIALANDAALAALQVTRSDDPDYQWMVTYGAGSTQKDYLKNIEGISVTVGDPGSGDYKWIPLATSIYENPDPAHNQVAWVQGTGMDDSFDPATGLSAAVQAKLDQYQHGISVDMGTGNDTATGTAYGDDFQMGSGTNYVDGGANGGTAPWGGRATDVLRVQVASQAALDAATVTPLAAGMSGTDADAFARGYAFKVVAGDEIDYVKGIERVDVYYPNGSNSAARGFQLAVAVNEADPSDPHIGSYSDLAWVTGTAADETIDASAASPLLSGAVKAEMDARKLGAWIDGSAGNDTITGTEYADIFVNGPGNSKIDGGANATASGQKGMDLFQAGVASADAVKAVQVLPSDDPAYQWMVTYGANSTQKDYLKNVEAVWVYDTTSPGQGKLIPLSLLVDEVSATTPGIDNLQYLANARGSALGETFDPATDLSAAAQALIAQHARGVAVDMGAGDDTMAGTAYGDDFVPGAGTNYVDGGDNRGLAPWHSPATDVVDIYVASKAEADAVQVIALSQSMTGDDGAAWAAGYQFKITNGSTEIDYLKNVETLNISIWNDVNQDGVHDSGGTSDPANEVVFVRQVSLVTNTAPTFGGLPPGVVANDAGLDNTPAGGIVLSSGKLLEAIFQTDSTNAETMLVLSRTNADGSVDTSFGAGGGRVTLPVSFGSAVAPVELADGKLLVAMTTFDSQAFEVLRLNADGSPDTGFGNGGAAVISAGTGLNLLYKAKIDPAGKIVLVGRLNDAAHDMAVVRLNADGSPDASFNGSGKLALALGAGINAAEDVSFTKDGKMVVAGFAGSGAAQLAVARINADGTLDSSFGSGGKVLMSPNGGVSHATAVQVLADGKVLVAGYNLPSGSSPESDAVLVRLNADGSADTAFGNGGVVKAAPGSGMYTAMQVQADGKIVTLGVLGTDAEGRGGLLTVTRYNADGSIDTSFHNGAIGSDPQAPLHGIGDQPASLALASDGRIVVFASSFNDMNYDASNVIVRLNADGSPDAGFGAANPSSLGGTVRMDGYHPAALDLDVSVYDAELAASGSYGGASVTLARHGGASLQDLFTGVGEVSLDGGNLSVDGTVIGSAIQAKGGLTLLFNSAATQGLVNRALHGIGYSNSSSTPPSQVTIDWTFHDGNSASLGGEKTAAGSTTVQIGPIVTETKASLADPTLSSTHAGLQHITYFGQVQGTLGADSFDSTIGFSAQERGLMAGWNRGATFDMGAGDDIVVGTPWADSFTMGSGTNRVDGGGGSAPYNIDSLEVYASSQADADAAQVSALDTGSTGADANAFAAGYTFKVVSGSETDYLKNVQQVDIWRWNDANGDHVRDSGEVTLVRSVPLALHVTEFQPSLIDPAKDVNGNAFSGYYWLANEYGTAFNDSVNAATDISSAAHALMDTYKRGVYIELGAGNDTAVGSSYGDTFNGGQGVNRLDGGANDGADPNGFAAHDSLQVYVSTQAGGAGTVSAVRLTAAMTGADGQAFADGYIWKVAAPGETDYIKNIEQVDVYTWNDANGNGARDSGETVTYAKGIPLVPQVSEVAVSTTDPTKDVNGNPLASYSQFAWVTGTAGDDVVNGAAGVSQATIGLMVTYKHGMSFDTGAGDDVVTGTDYGDWFNGGPGTNQIDGGGNYGVDAYGNHVRDILTVKVTPQAPTVSVTQLDATSTGADHDAFIHGYTWKISATGETDYIRNVEAVEVMNWNDANSNGQQDNGETTFSEIRLAPSITEVVASAADPTKDANGNLLANFAQFAWAYGTQGDDTINAANAVPQVQSLMDQYQRGMYFDTGAGNDTLTGTNYGDDFVAGPGVNRIDGFDNRGTDAAGQPARDVLEVFVANQAAADALSVTALTPAMTGDDGAAYAAGYRYKVANGSAEIDYVVNVEHVSVAIWNDANGNGQRDYSPGNNEVSFVRDITLGNSNTAPVVQLGGPLYTNGVDPVRFDKAPFVYDADLAKLDSYAGATLTLARHGGANADDVFGASGNVSFANGVLSVANTPIGHVTNAGGVLTLHFETGATVANVSSVVYAITYANQGTSPSASLTIDWTLADGNDGSQGSGGPLAATGSTDVHIGMSTSEVTRSATSPTLSTDGHTLSDYQYLGSAFGTAGGDTIDAGVFSSAAHALMDQYRHGASFNTYGGGDHVTGTAYGDNFQTGKGVNYVDGAANANGADWLHVVVPDKAALDAVQVTALAAGMQGADADAFAQGYTNKVVAGGETDYIKGIEAVNIVTSDGTFEYRDVALAVTTMEIGPSTAFGPVARILGTQNTETIDASGDTALLSAAAKAEANSDGRGVYIETGGGNDTITGTAHPDFIIKTGPGSTLVDGGDNVGPGGSQTSMDTDVFEVMVANAAAADAVSVVPSDDPNYQWMVTYGAGSTDKDYLKNIEGVSVIVPNSTAGKWIPLTMNIGQVTGDLSKAYNIAFVEGTAVGEHFTASTDLSPTLLQALDTYQRGASINMHEGDDVVVGTKYYDDINAGAGTNYVDGGGNAGTTPDGYHPGDSLHVSVHSQADLDAAQVTQLVAGMSGADADAFADGYEFKVTAAGETDYIKNIDHVFVENFARDGSGTSREVTLSISVNELSASDAVTSVYNAYVSGTAFNDTFNATVDVSPATQALMAQYGNGVHVDMGAGNDTVVGSAYGDDITVGSGVNYVDGGANINRGSNVAEDVLHITVGSQAEADAIAVITLDSSANGADLAAFNAGYTYKIMAGNEIDYVTNVERYDVTVWDDQNHNGQIDSGESMVVASHQLGASPAGVALVGVPVA